jgi:hypothetical protein
LDFINATVPAPISVAASQDWYAVFTFLEWWHAHLDLLSNRDGVDGLWSSFVLQASTPVQVVKVFISTAGYQTLVVLPEGCIPSNPSNCYTLRGGEYRLNASSTWSPNIANISSNIYPLIVDSWLGYSGYAELGFDDITLGWQGARNPAFENQTIGAFDTKDFYLGLFGICPQPSNFTNFDNPIPSYIENLKNQSLIPSISWSYTARNQYRKIYYQFKNVCLSIIN